jgi:uncharacterized membrane protein YfcA
VTEWWWAYLLVGSGIGFLAGLMGIGGGFIMVPTLAMIFQAKGFPADRIVHMGLATCMASIIFTSASSVLAHHRHGAVRWDVVKGMSPGVVVGTLIGALTITYINATLVSIFFSAFAYFAAYNLFMQRKPRAETVLPGMLGLSFAGAIIGGLASLAAVAGAAITVPYLVKRNVPMPNAVGVSAALGWPISVAGTVGYIIGSWNEPGIPGPSLGTVYLPALFFIVIGSMSTAQLGARVAHRVPVPVLKKVFSGLLFLLASRMLYSVLTQ